MAGLVPSLLLALFSAWCGTFAWGASSPAAVASALALLGVLFWTGVPWRDPLRLGATGRLLPAALWVAVAASCWASPVPRAGWVAVVLLPAFFGIPAVVERCWRREADRRLGLRALALTVAGVSLWALLDWMVLGSPRAAMPLGHHNLLAAWLVILLPLAALAAREPGWWRLSGVAAVGLAVLAILASRSLLGFAALGMEILAALGGRSPRQNSRQRRGWAVLLALALLVSFLQLPRILRIVSGDDPSAQARGAYWAAAVDGLRASPLLGWGPGSAAWTSAAFLDPVPRVNPWGESIGELHSLPLQIGYELGFTGLALALAIVVLFFARRVGDREEGRAPALLSAGLLGLGGGALASLGSGALAVTALPLAAAVAAGAALAGSGRGKSRMSSPLPSRIYALAALLALAPLLLAQWHYDRAVTADVAGEGRLAEAELEAAMRLDPSFPLYPMRLALLQAREPARQTAASELSLRAAWKGVAVPPLWLVAGIQGQAMKRPWAPFTLERACALDPLSPFPPFYQMLAQTSAGRQAPEAPVQGAQALLAEPRLVAAVFWERRPDLRRRVLDAVRDWPGVDAGWKEALLAVPPPTPQGPVSRVALLIDAEDRESLSLPVFRRRPWPAQWGLIEVRENTLERARLIPPAAASRGTSPGFLRNAPCLRRSAGGQDLLSP